MKSYDVVIIGAGPAGSALGYLLQKTDKSILLIDKAKFPRDKLCGGLFTEKTKDLWEKIFDEEFKEYKVKTNNVSIYYKYKKIVDTMTSSPFYLIDRIGFDYYCLQKYLNIGGNFLESTKVKTLNKESSIIELENGEKIKFAILVGADGATSQIRKFIFPKFKPNGFCMETSTENCSSDVLNIYFGCINGGYGWVFPKGTHSTIGYGTVSSKANETVKEFESYLNLINCKYEKSNNKGAYVPYGDFLKKPFYKNILLIGDAAGFVDPITGEGLYFALKSAQDAYESIINNIESDVSLVSMTYEKKIKYICKKISDSNYMKKMIFNPLMQKFAFKKLYNKSRAVSYICDNIVSHYNISYLQFPKSYSNYKKKKLKQNEQKDT